ncbi:MAG TPA: (deoxy)nucleoside triphosphate pyrophosphohydrolase [Isosphaeraceae bacterium]|nr:(deoxy)nucleoside triphosphate pyrophosphohydrolase [Isosphaeraceae bacterium]
MSDDSRKGREESPTRVAIGIIGRAGRFLIRQRPPLPGSPMPGYWEFPGGKCESGETPEQAVLRECLEEVGIPIVAKSLRREILHRYPHGLVQLYFFDCETRDPKAEPSSGTGFLWVKAHDLSPLPFPGANEPIVAELIAEADAESSSSHER